MLLLVSAGAVTALINQELALKRDPRRLCSTFEPTQNVVFIGNRKPCPINTVFLSKMSERFEQETRIVSIAEI